MRLVQVSVQLSEPTPWVVGWVPLPKKDSSATAAFGCPYEPRCFTSQHCSEGAQHCGSTKWWHLHFPPQTGGADREEGGQTQSTLPESTLLSKLRHSQPPHQPATSCLGIHSKVPIMSSALVMLLMVEEGLVIYPCSFYMLLSISWGILGPAALHQGEGAQALTWLALMPQCGSVGSRRVGDGVQSSYKRVWRCFCNTV